MRFTATIKDRVTACHCGMCRRWSGGVFLTVSTEGISWEGESLISTYTSSPWAERGFCRTCGTNLFYRVTAPGKLHGMTALMFGAIDDAEGLEIATELFIDRKPATYALVGQADHKCLTESEVLALFGEG